jgi:hypothetical protein
MPRTRLDPVPFVRLVTFVALILSTPAALADRLPPRSVATEAEDLAVLDVPPFPVAPHPALRSGSGIQWVRVHLPGQSPCAAHTASGSQTIEHVWCFEGAGGDSSWPAGTGTWDHYPAPGSPGWDGWQLTYDPVYAGDGNTCAFDDDWLWSAKEGNVPPEANGFHFLLVSPSIPVSGWTAGLVEYDLFLDSNGKEDVSNTVGRFYDTSSGWSLWNDFDGFLTIGGGFWGTFFDDVSDLLGPGVDSLQIAWEFIDVSTPGGATWGKHGGVKYFVDNVSVGSYDGTQTRFTARVIDFFTETFSLSDPAHTPFLENDEQGDWIGSGGARAFADDESLSVAVHDVDLMGAGDVQLYWSTNGGGTWDSKAMALSVPDSFGHGGIYRAIIGADDGGAEDMTASGDELVWVAGTQVDWYVEATDDDSNVSTWPEGAPGETFDFRVLPFGNTSPAQNGETYLVVEDNRAAALDVEHSGDFDPAGGLGFGLYREPVWSTTPDMVRDALDALGLVYDRYVVQGSGSTVETEPRGFADPANGIGGLMDELGNPNYDCIVWITSGGFTEPFSAESRLNLAAFLDGGGHVVTTGDGIATSLGTGGNGTDPVFLATYLGAEMANAADDETEFRRLDTRGVGALAGVNLGLYADCPLVRSLDRLTLAAPVAGSSNAVLLEYTNGGTGDEGRPSAILNERTASGGRAVLTGFDPGALVSHASRVCLYGSSLGTVIGLTIPVAPDCPNTGTGVEPVSALASIRLTPAEPNPFRERTSLRLILPRPMLVNVSVHDVAGRRIRTLADGHLPAGTHLHEWNGRTDAGAPASAGIYFVRSTAGEHRDARKVVLVR